MAFCILHGALRVGRPWGGVMHEGRSRSAAPWQRRTIGSRL